MVILIERSGDGFTATVDGQVIATGHTVADVHKAMREGGGAHVPAPKPKPPARKKA